MKRQIKIFTIGFQENDIEIMSDPLLFKIYQYINDN